jgi:hypothetical protein
MSLERRRQMIEPEHPQLSIARRKRFGASTLRMMIHV